MNGLAQGGAHTTTADHSHSNGGLRDGVEYGQFIEERFGRNLSTSLADQAKLAVRRRIAGVLTADVELSEALEKQTGEGRIAGISESDVFIFPTGMSSIFNAHQMLLAARGPMKSICFGFPYTDTLKTLEKWGPGCLFYGLGSAEDLDDLETRLSNGERYLGLFTEFPGNPLLKTPDLKRIRVLADKYDFAVVVDETVGNFLNINVLPYADIVVSSLTKIFSGDSNVMGGSAVLNPHGRYYESLKGAFAHDYEDILWAEDAVFLERNSRDFVSRIAKINSTTEAITAMLKESPLGKSFPEFLSRWSCS
jgi:cystathionine gamma-synthase